MTEFGAIGQKPSEYAAVDRLLDAADHNMQSWSYWQFKKFHDITTANSEESLYDGDGRLETAKLKLLSRTYAQAIAGTPVRMDFDSAHATFELEFNASVTSAPTEIYLNEAMYYPKGYRTEVEPSDCFHMEKHANRVLLHLVLAQGNERSCFGRFVKVRITASAAAELIV